MTDTIKEKQKKEEEGAATASLIRHAGALDAVSDMGDRIHEVADKYGNTGIESTAGRMAEEFHAGTFNADAAVKGRADLTARTTESMGQPHAPADLKVFQNGKEVAEGQMKYCGSNAKTTYELSDPKYDGMQKIHPAGQDVASLAGKRGVSGTGSRNYPDTAENANPTLKHEGVKSDPLSRDDALELAENTEKAVDSAMNKQMMTAVKAGTATGAAVGGTISLARNAKAVWDCEKDLGEAALDTVKDTASAGADGAVKSAAAVGVKEGLKRAGVRGLAKGSAPVAIAVTGVELVKDAGRFAAGDIDGEELAAKSGKTIVNGAGTWAGAEAGAAIGSMICPGVGTVVGGIVGGIAVSVGLSSLWN